MNQKTFKNYFNKKRFQRFTKNKPLWAAVHSAHYNQYRQFIIATSDQLIKNRLIFNHPWDMEMTHEFYDYKNKIKWNHSPNHDDEYIFMKNRHKIWFIMAQAYYLTKDEKYVIAWKKQFQSWIEEDFTKTGIESKVQRLLDKGIRMNNWVKIILLINDSPHFDVDVFTKMLAQMQDHVHDLESLYPEYQGLSNHGLLQNQGLIILKAYFGDLLHFNVANKIIVKRIEENAQLQVLPDGIQWEQSPMYHAWVLNSFLQIKKYSQMLKITFSDEFYENIKLLAYGIAKIIKPNGFLPTQNDSDNMNCQDLLARAALEFNDGKLKKLALQTFDFDTLLEYGLDNANIYKNIKAEPMEFTSIACEESGNYYMRSSWKKNAKYLTFRNGQYGSGHGHADVNHITIFANGIDWISNTGRYTYTETDERKKFKSAQYHNSQLINGLGASRIKNSWRFSAAARTFKLQPIISDNYDYFAGINAGFIFDKNPVLPLREIIFIKPGYWFINDTFYAKDHNQYEIRFHIDKAINITQKKQQLILKHQDQKFIIYNLSKIQTTIENGEISKHYNLKEPSKIIVNKMQGSGISNIATILDADNQIHKITKIKITKSANEKVSDSEAQAWEIMHENNNSEIIFLANTENIEGKKLYFINGLKFYGKKAIFWYKNKRLVKRDIFAY